LLSLIDVHKPNEFNLTLKSVSANDVALAEMLLPHVTFLRIIGMPLATLLPVFPDTGLTDLAHLEIYRTPYQILDTLEDCTNLWNAISKSTKLTSLILPEIPVPSFLKVKVDYSEVVSFRIARTFANEDEWSQTTLTILQGMPELQQLSLSSVQGSSTPSSFQYFPNEIVCTKLQKVKLVGWCPLSFCSIIFERCTALTELFLEGFDIEHELPPCGSVQILELKDCSIRAYNGLARSQNLRALRINEFTVNQLTITILKDLKSLCPSLEIIEIMGIELDECFFVINDKDVLKLVKLGTGSHSGSVIIDLRMRKFEV